MNEHGSRTDHSTGKSPNRPDNGGGGDEGRGLAKGNLSQQNASGLRAGRTRPAAGAGTTNGNIEQGCKVHRSSASHLPDHICGCLLPVRGTPQPGGEEWALRRALEENPSLSQD